LVIRRDILNICLALLRRPVILWATEGKFSLEGECQIINVILVQTENPHFATFKEILDFSKDH
jgi:hypothetical protein